MARIAICVALFFATAQAQSSDAGRKAYLAHCVGCHGDDGTGGGHGPDIVDVSEPLGVSKNAVREIILKGISDEGMPSFKIPVKEADAIAGYVMVLKTPADAASTANPAAGDPLAGERFFTGKGDCARCHMVRGRGGVLGPDLSNLAHKRRLAQIEQALVDPRDRGGTFDAAKPPTGADGDARLSAASTIGVARGFPNFSASHRVAIVAQEHTPSRIRSVVPPRPIDNSPAAPYLSVDRR